MVDDRRGSSILGELLICAGDDGWAAGDDGLLRLSDCDFHGASMGLPGLVFNGVAGFVTIEGMC